MDALCEDGQLPTSERDDLVRVSVSPSACPSRRRRFCGCAPAPIWPQCPSPIAAGAAQVPVVESEGQFGRG